MDRLMKEWTFIPGLCRSRLDGGGRMDGQHGGKVLVLLRKGSVRQRSSLCHVCLNPVQLMATVI